MAAEKRKKVDKVLVFAPPQICFHQAHKKARIESKDAHGSWSKTEFHFDGGKFVKTQKQDRRSLHCASIDTNTSEDSCIFLEYDPELVQGSINSYLDQVFSEGSPFAAAPDSCFVEVKRPATDENQESFSDLQKEYETVNNESQALLNGISNSPLTRTESRNKAKAKTLTARLVCNDTHPLTNEDVYTQQQTPNSVTENNDRGVCVASSSSSSKPRASASSKSTNDETSESPKSPSLSSSTTDHDQGINPSLKSSSESLTSTKASVDSNQNQRKTPIPTCALPKISDKLSHLSECTKIRSLVNLCVLVLQVNPVKEIQIKSGRNAGQFVPLSSIIVSDSTKSHFKLTLWRQASGWTEKIVAGDIIVATSIRIETWRDELIGQTTFNSSFYNLHQPQKPLASAWLQLISQDRLDTLVEWARKSYGYLFRKTSSAPVPKYTRISDLQNNTLVHFRGILRSVSALLTNKSLKNTYKFGSRRLPKISAVFAQSPNENICVTLWGRQSEWLDSLRKSEGSVWELQYLTAKHDSLSGSIVLHTTSKSTKKKLDANNKLAKPLLSLFHDVLNDIKSFKTIKELLDAKFSGTADVHGHIDSISFRSEDEVLEVNYHDVEALKDRCQRLTYVGCASCSRGLKQDRNKIYEQCEHYVHHKPGYNYAVKRHFRTIHLRVKDKDRIIEVIVRPESTRKLFKGIEANDLFLEGKFDQTSPKVLHFISLVKEIFSCDKLCKFILSCHTILDENSFVVSQTFELLDFKQG